MLLTASTVTEAFAVLGAFGRFGVNTTWSTRFAGVGSIHTVCQIPLEAV